MPRAIDDPRAARWLGVGLATWAVFVAFSLLPAARVSLIDAILVFAPLVVVPLARPLLVDMWFPPPSVMYAAALCFAFAFVDPDTGAGGAMLAFPWLIIAATVATRTGLRIVERSLPALVDVAGFAACVFLGVGAFFAVATRAGWIIAGIEEPIIELTGVHFHYAGFATLVLATTMARALPARPALTRAVLGVACVAPPVVAVGFTWKLAPFQVGGAVLLTIATWSLAATMTFLVAPSAARLSRAFLVVSSLAVLAPMVLALAWATSQYADVAALSIPAMAAIHGTLNAFGFVTCGLIGWRLRVDGAV